MTVLFEIRTFLDYIDDNCLSGKTERFNKYCNLMLDPMPFDVLNATCHELDGQLTWFETTQEFNHLIDRVFEYHPDDFNGHLWTGK